MEQLSYYFNRLVQIIVKISEKIIILLGLTMLIVILLQVTFRFVIYVPFPQSEELARYLMIALAMFGSVIALRQGRHIGVRVVVERLPEGVYDKYFAPLIQLIIAAFFAFLTYYGYDFAARNAHQMSATLGISMYYPYLSIPIGSFLCTLVVIADIFQDFYPTTAGSSAKIAAALLEPEAENKVDTIIHSEIQEEK